MIIHFEKYDHVVYLDARRTGSGLLFGEFSNTDNNNSSNFVVLSDGSNVNSIYIGKDNTSVRAILFSNSALVFSNNSIPHVENNKFALSYKSGEIKLFINGVKIIEDISTFTFTNPLNRLDFGAPNGTVNASKASWGQIQVFKTALTDAELQTLTTI